MIEVNVRTLKAGLSRYLQIMQSGELIAIKVRDRRVGFLTLDPPQSKKKGKKGVTDANTQKLLSRLKAKGYIQHVKRYSMSASKPVALKQGPSLSTIIRQMRDEE